MQHNILIKGRVCLNVQKYSIFTFLYRKGNNLLLKPIWFNLIQDRMITYWNFNTKI